MTILFIENRYKTTFFELIAQELLKEGHQIHWLVQNKEFKPKQGLTHVLSYPKKFNVNSKNPEIEKIIAIDRQQNHFNKKDKSYFYNYNDQIEAIVKNIQPKLVFGEATVFHELLTINICRNHNILFLNPSSCRYPVGRFSFYLFDTLIPYKGSQETLSDNNAKLVVESIVNRNVIPNYMNILETKKKDIFFDKYLKVKSYIKGERFNTPHPVNKYLTEKNRKKRIDKWNLNAVLDVKKDKKFKVLYPLQMQPESSIDVYGKDFINQTKLIREISDNLPKDAVLYLKPNPKSNLELTDELLNLVENSTNIIHLHHQTKMDTVFSEVNLVITVTGTVAIECILSNIPIITLVESINDFNVNCKLLSNLNSLKETIDEIIQKQFPIISLQDKINFINELNKTSYKGVVSDPFSDPNCISKENINDMFTAFKEVINLFEKQINV